MNRLKDEELQDVTKENIRGRLLKVLDDLKKAEPTSLTEERIRKELEIIETISNPNSSERDIIEASFKVDCLCFDNDLTPEKTTTILEYVNEEKKEKKEGYFNMEDLFKYAKEIRDTQKAPNNSKFYSILKQLEVLENNIDLSEIKDCKIRFQDYIDFNKNYQENYEYFCKYYNSDNELLNFNIYYLKKELSDILEMIVIGDLTVEEVDYLYSESFYSDIDSVINNIKRSFSKEFDNPLSKNINKAMVRSIFILPNNLDEIKDLSINSRSGAGLISIKKSLVALETLICTSYNDKEFSRHIHKIKNGRGNDLRLTEDKILGERYSTGKQTKVGFCKLPVHPENLKKLEDKF